jgi:hypothetical protein
VQSNSNSVSGTPDLAGRRSWNRRGSRGRKPCGLRLIFQTPAVREISLYQGLPTSIQGWRSNVEVRDGSGLIGVADALFDGAKLIVEIDGWAYHSTLDCFQRDRERQNRLVAAGWTVPRFTWRDLTQNPDWVIATIRWLLGSSVPEQRCS